MEYDVYLVTMNKEDGQVLIDGLEDLSVYLTIYYLDTLEGCKKGRALLSEFGAKKSPFICVKFKGTVIRCFYSEQSDDVINNFLNWIYFNSVENTEIIPQVENYLQEKLKVKVKNTGKCKLPDYADSGSSGADLRANIKEAITIEPGKWQLVPTGLHMSIPKGFEMQVRPRSGLALKNGISVLNTPGTIDSTYRGDIGVILMNFSDKPFTIYPADRIAQGVFIRVVQASFDEVDELDETERGEGGYGHSGVK